MATLSPSSVVAPIVNLNGSSKRSLLDDNHKAKSAIDAAIEALAEVTPHPRDYPGREGEYQSARNQHVGRLASLKKIADDLDEIAIQIDAQ